MPDEYFLREQAREAIRSGTLPTRKPDRTYGGHGSGIDCAVCGQRMTRDQPEFEIEFSRNGMTAGVDSFHLHPRCYAAWEFERTKGEADGPVYARWSPATEAPAASGQQQPPDQMLEPEQGLDGTRSFIGRLQSGASIDVSDVAVEHVHAGTSRDRSPSDSMPPVPGGP
jgi:hypothetical protein